MCQYAVCVCLHIHAKINKWLKVATNLLEMTKVATVPLKV